MKNYKIYLISAQIGEETLYKIGHTKRRVEDRIRDFKTGNASQFDIIGVFNCNKYHITLEKRLHRHFDKQRVSGEWFQLEKSHIHSFGELCNRLWDEIDMLSTQNTYMLDKNIKLK